MGLGAKKMLNLVKVNFGKLRCVLSKYEEFCQNMMDFSQDVPWFFMMLRDRNYTLSLYTLSVGQVIVGVMSFHKIYWFDRLKVVQLAHVLVPVLVLVLVEKFEKVWKSLKKCGKVWKSLKNCGKVWKKWKSMKKCEKVWKKFE